MGYAGIIVQAAGDAMMQQQENDHAIESSRDYAEGGSMPS